MRHVCYGRQAQLDSLQYEYGGSGPHRGYGEDPGGYAPRYCGVAPLARRCRYEDGFNDGSVFAV